MMRTSVYSNTMSNNNNTLISLQVRNNFSHENVELKMVRNLIKRIFRRGKTICLNRYMTHIIMNQLIVKRYGRIK